MGRPVSVRAERGMLVTSLVAMALTVAGCTSTRTTAPERTATEQLLLSTAADDAIGRLDLGLTPGTRAYVETAYLQAYDSPYVIGAIRDKLLRSGLMLVAERDAADVVIEARAGALAIDEDTFLIGVPSWDVPIPFAATPLSTPELALFKRDRREGIAKLALTAYAIEDGRHAGSSGPAIGRAHKTRRLVLFVGWTEQDIPPDRQSLLP